MDADEQFGQPIVSNGLPLSKIHHAAFDAQLIGIDPDFRIHVSDRLLDIHDGPFWELGLKGIAGQVIELPRRKVRGAKGRARRCGITSGTGAEWQESAIAARIWGAPNADFV
jgi:hypothetical protein